MSNKIIYGLIGYPVTHSLSPAMHNAAFNALNINAEYRLFEIIPDNLEDFLLTPDTEVIDTRGNRVRAGDIAGFNITVPHKVRAKEILEKKYPHKSGKDPAFDFVELIGSINTVKREPTGLRYWNSDAPGFVKSLEEDLNFEIASNRNTEVLVMGCGGAGRAVIAALSWHDGGIAKIYAYDINAVSAKTTADYFSKFPHAQDTLEIISKEKIADIINRCQLLVNASSLGMKDGDASPIAKNLLHKDLRVYDVVYNKETQLLRDAKSLNIPVTGGLGMLLYQGAAAFTLWTGRDAPVGIMKNALVEELKKI